MICQTNKSQCFRNVNCYVHSMCFTVEHNYYTRSCRYSQELLPVRTDLSSTIACVLVDPTYSASTCWMSRPTTDYTSGKNTKQGVALTGRNTTGPPCSVTVEL